MRARHWPSLMVLVALGLSAASAPVAAAAPRTVECGSLNMKGGLRLTDITAAGVSCSYVEKTFFAELDQGTGTPTGWTATRKNLGVSNGGGNSLLAWRSGEKIITYRAYLPIAGPAG